MAASGDERGRMGSRGTLASRGIRSAVSILATVAAGFVLAPAAFSATPGLVAAYGFEEGAGAVVGDASGAGNDGTIAHASWTSSGVYGDALILDGSGPGVTVPDSSSLHLRRGMTLEAWVNPTVVDEQWRDIVYKGDDSYFLEATSPGNAPAAGGTFRGQGTNVFATAPLATGTWTYLAVTYDGQALRLYVNGDEVSSVARTGRIAASGRPLELGGDSIYGQGFQGLIDEVRVYNVALTPTEIRSDMETPVVSGTARDTEPPSAPGTLTATPVGVGEVDLSWGASTDNVGVTGYQVERCLGASCTTFAQIATPTTTTYKDTSVTASNTYSYRVRATDAAGNLSPYSNTANATTPTPDTQPPTQPGTLTATAISAGEVDLSWGASTDNVGVTGYQIERCQGSGCSDYAQIGTSTGTSYSDTTTSPDTSYSYRVRAEDAAGNTGDYSNSASATTPTATAPAGPGPLHVDPTGRYLVDGSGAPFLMTGDSPQALIGNLTESDAKLFFSTRKAQGFNTVWINLLCNGYTGCRQDGETWDGIAPFTTPGDLSTPNEAYFLRVDQMIQLAAQYGFVVLLDPAETGGWLDTLVSNGVDKDRAYGQYLGRRYGGFSNIIWMSGNDYQSYGPGNDPYVTAVAQGIRDTDPSALQTVELNYNTSGSLDDPTWAPLIDLNASYTYDPTYIQVLKDYNRSSFLPTFMVEASYEDEQNNVTYPYGSPQQLRRQEYWSLLSGATGQLYGNHSTWQFLCSQRDPGGNCVGGWKDQMASPGATQMANVVALFSPRRWYDLVPDQNHTLVTSGYGTFGQDDYVTAASTPDGKLAMAYLPSGGTVTVNLGTLSGPVTARWYDPTDGTFTTIGPFANDGSVTLGTPPANAAGDNDWVLVLEVS